MTEDLHAYHVYVAVAVEGESDTGMAQTLLRHVHLTLSRPCLVKRGVTNLDPPEPTRPRCAGARRGRRGGRRG